MEYRAKVILGMYRMYSWEVKRWLRVKRRCLLPVVETLWVVNDGVRQRLNLKEKDRSWLQWGVGERDYRNRVYFMWSWNTMKTELKFYTIFVHVKKILICLNGWMWNGTYNEMKESKKYKKKPRNVVWMNVKFEIS